MGEFGGALRVVFKIRNMVQLARAVVAPMLDDDEKDLTDEIIPDKDLEIIALRTGGTAGQKR
jgi:hypothetical protein